LPRMSSTAGESTVSGEVWTPANPESAADMVAGLKRRLEDGADWLTCLLETMARWTLPVETYRGRRFNYFIAGEAFDWVLLAERLLLVVGDLVPSDEIETLLLSGRVPASFDRSRFRQALGVEKYRGYLNYFYGVTVEEALQLSTELERYKRHASNGLRYKTDVTDEVFSVLYGSAQAELLEKFREETGPRSGRYVSLSDAKEFTYWLFTYRINNADKARIASDTKKGLAQLERMGGASGWEPGPY